MSDIPTTMRAVVQNHDGSKGASVREIPVPSLDENDVLIKVAYAAQNPTDWKHVGRNAPPDAIIGCDISGTVVKVGSKLANPSIKLGDKVACTVHGGIFKDKGGYAEYARAESDLLWKVPEGLKMEEAATFACAWVTALQALVMSQKKECPPKQVEKDTWILIYGASSSVGLFAVSLAKAMGYRIVAVCSSKNFDLVKSYGAEACVDYKDGREKVSKEIKSITGGGVSLAMDTISEKESSLISLDSFGSAGGQLNLILPPSDEVRSYRKDVKVENTLMYTLFGIEFNMTPGLDEKTMIPVPPGSREFHVELCKHTPDLISKYGVKPNPVHLRGGLDDVLAGWQDMKDGKVSAQKYVYKVNP